MTQRKKTENNTAISANRKFLEITIVFISTSTKYILTTIFHKTKIKNKKFTELL